MFSCSTSARPRRFVSFAVLFCVVLVTLTGCTKDEIDLFRAVMSAESSHHMEPHLVCLRRAESANFKPSPYVAVNPSGKYRGAYQYSRSTWANHAKGSGHGAWATTDPIRVPPRIQDEVAYWGMQHNPTAWAGDHCGAIPK